MIKFQRIATLCVFVAMLLGAFPDTGAARSTAVDILPSKSSATVEFPLGIQFDATIWMSPEPAIDRVELLYRPLTDPTLRLAVVAPDSVSSESDSINVATAIDLQTDYLPSGIDIVFFWRLFSGPDVIGETAPEQVSWHDTRFDWTTYDTPQIRLRTYHLSDTFAASVANTAQQTVTALEARFAMQPGLPISIWIYQNTTDFAAAKQLNSREAVAGASYAGYYVIHLVLREGDDREVGRTVTHEVSHQCLFQAVENPYSLAPLWFDEGMATHAQTAGMDSYLPLAITSANTGSLYKLDSLSSGFPYQPSEAAIAYATSWSAISYVIDRWGDDGIARLIEEFSEGRPSDDAILSALGISADDLDLGLGNWLRDRA